MSTSARTRYLRHRRRWMRSLRFETPAIRQAYQTMTDLVEDNAVSPPGAKDVIAVTAPFAVGKSTLVRTWAQDRYRDIIGDRIHLSQLPTWNREPGVVADEVPVVWLDLEAASKVRAFNIQLLQYFGYPISGAITDLTARIHRILDAHRVRLLVVDDANLLNLRHRDARDVLDHLKHINTVLGQRGASLVLVGADLEDGAVVRDPQMAGRLRTISLKPCPIDTPAEITRWQNTLAGIEDLVLPYLPAAQRGILAGHHAPRIWRLTQGYLGDVARLIAEAAHLAAHEDTWTLRITDLERAQLSKRAQIAAPRLRETPAGRPRGAPSVEVAAS
ncbi:TniB family NTP-binding protein [Isoptericola sp. NPDC019571]|uniref:TniB family NTP-binding protein n=1 Tax=Isoptericola sp. NPDC019571 TaxID=3364008 RepID=UPI003789DBF7